MKFQPQFSARRDSALSLNGEVKIDGERIVCRHLAKLWEDDFLRTAGKPSYHTLNSPDAIQAAAGALALKAESKYANFAHERINQAQYWISNDWGQVLTDNFKAMSLSGGGDVAVCRTLYLMTPTHAMALGLKIKGSAAARRFVVQFYDPNNTVAHRRVAITAASADAGVPAEIRKLQAHDFLPEFFRKAYRLVDADDRSIPALFAGEKAEPGMPRLAGDLPDFDEHVLPFLQNHDLPELLRACADQLSQRGDMTRLLTLLGSGHSNTPRLYFALQWGQVETIEILGDILKTLQSRLSSEQLADLLSARLRTGTPGLFAALYGRKSEAVLAFGEMLKTFRPFLSSEHLTDLLSAKYWSGSFGPWDGAPALHFSLCYGHTEMVQAFLKILNPVADSLSPEQRLDLLSAKDRNGTPGISLARQRGHIETAAAYENLLAQFVGAPPTGHLKAQP